MRSDWTTRQLGELCRIEIGGTPPRGMSRFWDQEKTTDNVWLSIADMPKTFHARVSSSAEHLSDEGAKRVKIVKAGTLLVSFKLTLGRLAYTDIDLRTNEAIAALELLDQELLNREYLYWYLTFFDWQKAAEGEDKIKGKTLNKAKLAVLPVLVPPLTEQQRIVAILDEAFAGLATATTNVEKNLKNARELFKSYLRTVFDQTKPLRLPAKYTKGSARWQGASELESANSTRTGGRAASTRHIEGRRSLCVGSPKSRARVRWKWRALEDLARMESGHTPSRRHPEYWGGDVPWIGIRDAKAAHGREIFETLEYTNKLGLENSSARLLPAQTVCLSRTASVGYVTVMGRPMATSQDFVSWVCSEKLLPQFLMYLFLAQGEEIFRFSSGAVHQTIYFPETKAFHICLPSVDEQSRIVAALNVLRDQAEKLEAHYERRLAQLAQIKQSILNKAFSGKLTSIASVASSAALLRRQVNPKRDTAVVLALAHERHRRKNRDKSFLHTKAQKILHEVEAEAGYNLGRKPIQDAAGPNDFQHMLAAEDWAEENEYFKFLRRNSGGYQFRRLRKFDELLKEAGQIDPQMRVRIERVIDVFIPMDARQAEAFSTARAAWNNLVLDGVAPTDDAIVAACYAWHPKKSDIPRSTFIEALRQIRKLKMQPNGRTPFVPPTGQSQLPL